MWWNVFLFVGSLVLSYLLKPKAQTPQKQEDEKPAGLGDFDFPTVSPGRSIPVVFGTRWVEGPNVVWYGDLKVEEITEEQEMEGGGKKK